MSEYGKKITKLKADSVQHTSRTFL